MDLSVFSTAIQNALGEHLPAILGAVGILVVGYLIALLARAAVRKLLSLLRVNSFVSSSVGKPWISKAVLRWEPSGSFSLPQY